MFKISNIRNVMVEFNSFLSLWMPEKCKGQYHGTTERYICVLKEQVALEYVIINLCFL